MNYKEKYEQALELMKDCIPDEDGLVHIRPDDIFSELKESDGDKMMEDIIYSLNQYMSCINNAEHLRPSDKKYCTENVMKQIAWLENIPYTIDQAKREGFHLGYKACLEKPEEDNPCSGCTNDKGCLNCEDGSMKETQSTDKAEQIPNGYFDYEHCDIQQLSSAIEEQKPAWSEEDQNALEDVREAVVNYWGGDTQDILLYWLKSLKSRVKCADVPQQQDMIKALRTEYEKGRADVIAKACSFLHHYQEYPNHDIATDKLVEAFKMHIEL